MASQTHNCGHAVERVVCWTENAPARRFERCSRWQATHGCNYFEWVDEPLDPHYRGIVNLLIESSRAAARELDHRRGIILHLQHQLNYLRTLETSRRHTGIATIMGGLAVQGYPQVVPQGIPMTLNPHGAGPSRSSSEAGPSGTK